MTYPRTGVKLTRQPASMAGFWDNFTSAGQAVGGSILDAASTEMDKALFDLKATLGTTAILAFIGAATGTYLVIRNIRL